MARRTWTVDGKFSTYLDLMRWLAALIVVVQHIKGLFFVTYSELEHPNILLKLFYAIASTGHQAVIVFFVLSGYFISANVMKNISNGSWSWKSYLTNRLSRLYVVLIPCLLIGLFWDSTGIHLFGDTGVYSGLPEDQYILGFSTVEHSTAGTFIGNLFFVQEIIVGHYGSNGPLWSLSYEFWYYLLFPCIALVMYSPSWTKKIIYTVLTASICLFLSPPIMLYFLVWIIGFMIHLLPVSRVRFAKVGLILFSLLFIFLFVFHNSLNTFLSDLIIGVLFGTMVFLMKVVMHGKKASKLSVQWSKLLAGFSYTIYLSHFPLLVFIHAMVYDKNPTKWQPNVLGLSYGLILLLGTLVYCWLVSYITERRTDTVRLWIVRLTNKRRRLSPHVQTVRR